MFQFTITTASAELNVQAPQGWHEVTLEQYNRLIKLQGESPGTAEISIVPRKYGVWGRLISMVFGEKKDYHKYLADLKECEQYRKKEIAFWLDIEPEILNDVDTKDLIAVQIWISNHLQLPEFNEAFDSFIHRGEMHSVKDQSKNFNNPEYWQDLTMDIAFQIMYRVSMRKDHSTNLFVKNLSYNNG